MILYRTFGVAPVICNANGANKRILRMNINEIRTIRPCAVFALRFCTVEKKMKEAFHNKWRITWMKSKLFYGVTCWAFRKMI